MEKENLVTILGETLPFWMELRVQAKALNLDHLLREIAGLIAKVSFYESRINEMSAFKGTGAND